MKKIKNKKILISIIAILLIILGIIIMFSFNKNEKNDYTSIKEKNTYTIYNLHITKFYRNCDIVFDMIREKLDNDDLTYYEAYFLDKDNNLLYSMDLKSFSNFKENENSLHVVFGINYDVSNTEKIKVVFKGKTYKYNKDLRNKLEKLPNK